MDKEMKKIKEKRYYSFMSKHKMDDVDMDDFLQKMELRLGHDNELRDIRYMPEREVYMSKDGEYDNPRFVTKEFRDRYLELTQRVSDEYYTVDDNRKLYDILQEIIYLNGLSVTRPSGYGPLVNMICLKI